MLMPKMTRAEVWEEFSCPHLCVHGCTCWIAGKKEKSCSYSHAHLRKSRIEAWLLVNQTYLPRHSRNQIHSKVLNYLDFACLESPCKTFCCVKTSLRLQSSLFADAKDPSGEKQPVFVICRKTCSLNVPKYNQSSFYYFKNWGCIVSCCVKRYLSCLN